MQAVIIAGGEGTRLRPLTYQQPKPIVPFFDEPFLGYQLHLLAKYGCRDVILNLHYRAEALKAALGDGSRWGVRLQYVFEERPLGTAGAVKNAERLITSDTILVFNGDILSDLDLDAFLAFHRSRRAQVTIGLTRVPDPTAYGLVFLEADGRITRFVEKPSYDEATVNTVNTGLYLMETALLSRIPEAENHSFERGLFPQLLEEGLPLFGYTDRFYWLDIGTPRKYVQGHRDRLRGRLHFPLKGRQEGEAWIGAGCDIDPSVVLSGPVFIGPGCRLEKGVWIEGPTALSAGCQIGANSRMSDCVLLRECQVGAGCDLSGVLAGPACHIADNCHLTDGLVLAEGSRVARGTRMQAWT